MAARGKFIVVEGIDGSGKRTQIGMLARAFAERSIPCQQVSFPNYEGFFGQLVGRFLNGGFGTLDTVDPHFSALLYAGDRLESKGALEAALASGKTLLADRYVASNLAHQGARVAPEKRGEFLRWLRQLEYQVYGLPAEDLVIYLHVPVDNADQLIGKRAAREDIKRPRDLQEASRSHLEAAAQVYDELARQPNWVTIECVDAASGSLRTPAAIHDEVISAISARAFLPALAAR